MDPHISFIIEQENNGQIPFLDILVPRHDKNHKVSTEATLLLRALHQPNTTERKIENVSFLGLTIQRLSSKIYL